MQYHCGNAGAKVHIYLTKKVKMRKDNVSGKPERGHLSQYQAIDEMSADQDQQYISTSFLILQYKIYPECEYPDHSFPQYYYCLAPVQARPAKPMRTS